MFNSIRVIHRTSSTFIASINSSKLSIWVDGTIMKGDVENGTIGSKYSDHPQVVLNKTLRITLSSLNLNTSTNLVVQMNASLNSASIFVFNCLNITHPEYLIFRCNTSDRSKNILSNNCTYTCSNLEPGSIFNASFIRLPIPIADEISNTFPEETFQIIYLTG